MCLFFLMLNRCNTNVLYSLIHKLHKFNEVAMPSTICLRLHKETHEDARIVTVFFTNRVLISVDL